MRKTLSCLILLFMLLFLLACPNHRSKEPDGSSSNTGGNGTSSGSDTSSGDKSDDLPSDDKTEKPYISYSVVEKKDIFAYEKNTEDLEKWLDSSDQESGNFVIKVNNGTFASLPGVGEDVGFLGFLSDDDSSLTELVRLKFVSLDSSEKNLTLSLSDSDFTNTFDVRNAYIKLENLTIRADENCQDKELKELKADCGTIQVREKLEINTENLYSLNKLNIIQRSDDDDSSKFSWIFKDGKASLVINLKNCKLTKNPLTKEDFSISAVNDEEGVASCSVKIDSIDTTFNSSSLLTKITIGFIVEGDDNSIEDELGSVYLSFKTSLLKLLGAYKNYKFATDTIKIDFASYGKEMDVPLDFVLVKKPNDEHKVSDIYDDFYNSDIDYNFYICNHEVTNAEFDEYSSTCEYYTTKHKADFQGDDIPVSYVTWYDAVNYCNWRSKKEGLDPYYNIEVKDVLRDSDNGDYISSADVSENNTANGYRLLSSSEYIWAANGGNKRDTNVIHKYSGDKLMSKTAIQTTIDDVAWYSEGSPQIIKTKLPNELGIYDMSGNVAEFVSTDSVGGGVVYYGGSYNTTYNGGAGKCYLNSSGFSLSDRNHFGSDIGFRIARNR